MTTRRQFLQMAGATAVVIPRVRTSEAMTSELVAELNPGDVLRVEHPKVFVDRASPPPQGFTFAWLTDTHHRRNNEDMRPHISHVLGLGQSLTFLTGDIVDLGTQPEYEEITSMLSGVWCVPGNHSEPLAHTDPGPNDYTYYISHGPNRFRFAVTHQDHKFIGFTSHLNRDVYAGFAHIDQVDRTFVEDELASAPTGSVIWLLTHFPPLDLLGHNIRDWWDFDGGQGWLLNLCNQYDVRAVLYGHRHVGFRVDTDPTAPNTKFIHGGCLSYDIGFPDGRFQLVEIVNGAATIKLHRGRPPYDLLETVTI